MNQESGIKNISINEFKNSCGLPIKEANLLVSFVLNQPLTFVLTEGDMEIPEASLKKLKKLAERRRQGEPMAYLFGHQEFHGLDFIVNKHTLIPRPETEMMVDEIVSLARDSERQPLIFDLGTGSGCIAITLAKLLNQKIIAIDISADALKVAKQNARINDVSNLIVFEENDLLKDYLNFSSQNEIIIAANLPYLTAEQVANSPTIKFEPKSALISGEDGLDHYRQLFAQAKTITAAKLTLFCEIDDTQGKSMTELIKKELPDAQFEIRKDIGDYDRLAIIKL